MRVSKRRFSKWKNDFAKWQELYVKRGYDWSGKHLERFDFLQNRVVVNIVTNKTRDGFEG